MLLTLLFFKCLFILRENERVYKLGRVRQGERESQAGSQGLDKGLNFTNCEIMTCAEIKSWMFNQLGHPGAPAAYFKHNHIEKLKAKGRKNIYYTNIKERLYSHTNSRQSVL